MSNFYDEALKKTENTIVLNRVYRHNGTHGDLVFPDGTVYDTLENSWEDNQRRISCVPEGIYPMRMRYSPIVKRTSGGEFSEGWEIADVPNRDYIMCHIGNWTKDTAGCLLIGSTKAFDGNEPVVWGSSSAFRKFMAKMEAHDEWRLIIKEKS